MTTGTQHADITDSYLHVCKGMAAASQGAFPVADGSGGQDMTYTAGKNANLFDNNLIRASLKDYAEKVNALGSITGSATVDVTLGNVVTATLTGSTTLSLSNPSPTANACSVTLILTQGGTGSYTITWPGAVKWAGGTAPTLTTTVGGVDIIMLVTVDAGTTWYGFTGGLAFA